MRRERGEERERKKIIGERIRERKRERERERERRERD